MTFSILDEIKVCEQQVEGLEDTINNHADKFDYEARERHKATLLQLKTYRVLLEILKKQI